MGVGKPEGGRSPLAGPPVNQGFRTALNALVAVARRGQRPDSEFFNPGDKWLLARMPVFQDMPPERQQRALEEYEQISKAAAEAEREGIPSSRAGPDAVFRLDSGGLAFFSQLGVRRRPDLTQYFIDGFPANRDGVAFSEANQELFAEIFPYVTSYMEKRFARGDMIVQTDRRICDAPDRSFHARQLLFGARYLQIPYMWRQLTFDLPPEELATAPEIIEVSLPSGFEELGVPAGLRKRLEEAGLEQLVFKAPSVGLSFHLGIDYVGEHKMGPLSVAMFLAKRNEGMALQAALSVARARTIGGKMANTAVVTTGPSLHGKSTLTIMIELEGSWLSKKLGLAQEDGEGVYPMNDDIVLLQPVSPPFEAAPAGQPITVSYGIDGTENNFYAVPSGLTPESDPITYEVLRGARDAPNPQETLENVVVDPHTLAPDFLQNPTRNMRMVLSRARLIERKRARQVLETITSGRLSDCVHVPMGDIDRVFWQAVMRLNTVAPPLRRLDLKAYVRVLMFGEAVQMGAATGTIGRPYVEYFSDPFIIGLEDDNANLLYRVLQEMEKGGQRQEYYVFNTGGIGAETDESASGPRYKKIPRELTLTLQEALLRGAVQFEHDVSLGRDVAVAIVDGQGRQITDLRGEWLPRSIYGTGDYDRRVVELQRRRYYGRDGNDKAGILRYTKVTNDLFEIERIPHPQNEREIAWLLSFFWSLDLAYNNLPEVAGHLSEGAPPAPGLQASLRSMYEVSRRRGLELPRESVEALKAVRIVQA